jgi:hypothetical protein
VQEQRYPLLGRNPVCRCAADEFNLAGGFLDQAGCAELCHRFVIGSFEPVTQNQFHARSLAEVVGQKPSEAERSREYVDNATEPTLVLRMVWIIQMLEVFG